MFTFSNEEQRKKHPFPKSCNESGTITSLNEVHDEKMPSPSNFFTFDGIVILFNKEQFVLPKENYSNKITICALINSIVWLLATILYVYTLINTNIKIWEIFIWAVPVCSILTSIMNRYWGKRKYSVYLTSITFWSLIISIYIQALEFNIWPIFIIGAPLQVTTILWSRIRPKKTKDRLFQADK